MTQIKVGIVGAGLSGLVAAKEFSSKGIEVTVYEKLTVPGGRMRTEKVGDWKLDVGFQVLLTAYPYLQKHVDLSKLNLQKLEAAATIFRSGRTSAVGDPFRTKNVFWATVFSDIGSVKDKWLIFKLKRFVDKHSIDELFKLENNTSIEFLEKFGFSERIIVRFFKPFFGGIFLENDLTTSSRMLLFVFKMFSTGNAAIPKNGIGEVAQLLVDQLPEVSFHYNSEVEKVLDETIYLKDGSHESFDYVITTIPNNNEQSNKSLWQDCTCFYFEHSSPRIIETARIGLNANSNRFINTIFYPSSLEKPVSKYNHELISITVLNSKGLENNELRRKVEEELKTDFTIDGLKFIQLYHIPFALPKSNAPQNDVSFDKNTKTFNVGDFLMNGSQNAACKVGELIASHVMAL